MLKLKITLSDVLQIKEFKEEIDRTRKLYGEKLTLDYEQDIKDKRIFILSIAYPYQNRLLDWQMINGIKSEFKKQDKNIKVEKL